MTTLADALRDAIECVESWAAYASPYFQEKHNLRGDLDRLHAALAAHDAQQQEVDSKSRLKRLAVQQQEPCIGRDPLCPCQDGLACHYKDYPGSKGWPHVS
jgi:hypothetical protein